MPISETLKKNWIYIVFVIILILPLTYVIVSYIMIMNEPSYALTIEEMNDNDTIDSAGEWNNGTFVYTSNPFINLTEEDFKTFPKLAPIIRDKSQKSSDVGSNGRVAYRIDYWEEEHYTFVSRFGYNGYLEYKGKRYHFIFMNVD
jgi:hypothetical protein